MIAVDTNVVIRLLTQDDRKQAAIARALFASEAIWISKTVLLEADWVLRSLYDFEEIAIVDAFTKLLGLANVHTEDKSAIATALAMCASGLDFAYALHFTSKPPGAQFVSFDRLFVRRAKRFGVTGIAVV